MMSTIRRLQMLKRDNSGATAIEYGLIAAFITVCLIASMPYITGALDDQFKHIGDHLRSGN